MCQALFQIMPLNLENVLQLLHNLKMAWVFYFLLNPNLSDSLKILLGNLRRPKPTQKIFLLALRAMKKPFLALLVLPRKETKRNSSQLFLVCGTFYYRNLSRFFIARTIRKLEAHRIFDLAQTGDILLFQAKVVFIFWYCVSNLAQSSAVSGLIRGITKSVVFMK